MPATILDTFDTLNFFVSIIMTLLLLKV